MPFLAAALLGSALAVPPSPEVAAEAFLKRYLEGGAVAHLGHMGDVRSLLTPRLRRVLDDASACQRDWGRKLPKEWSTDKPPFADCCLFSSGSDGMPRHFRIVGTKTLPDGRRRVDVEYTFIDMFASRSTDASASWTHLDAVVLALVKDRYLVDDFVYVGEEPSDASLLLSESFSGCEGRKWVGGE
jgi:hypothetical protein